MLRIHISGIGQSEWDIDEQVDASRLALLAELIRDASLGFVKPVHVRMRARAMGESIMIEGWIDTSAKMTCSRCLSPFELPIDIDFRASAVEQGNVPGDDPSTEDVELSANDMDVIPYSGESIDLCEEVAQQIIMALPFKPLCRETCKGLCSGCGVDLNHTPCQCDNQDPNSPFAVLTKLSFPQGKA